MISPLVSRKLHRYLLVISLLISSGTYAQNWQTGSIDSLVEKGALRSAVQSFYVKPVFEQYQNIVSIKGNEFEAPKGDLVRKRGFGIRVGYKWERFELETGLSMIRPVVGFRYTLTGSGYTTRTAGTDFYHAPVVFRYHFWKPTKNLSFRVGVGIAYNFDLDKLKLASDINAEQSTFDANGNRVVLTVFKGRYEQQKSFFSGEVNASVRYNLTSRFSASLEARRLISATNIVRFSGTQQLFNPSVFRDVDARGGANGYAINFGVAYRFGFRNQYHLN